VVPTWSFDDNNAVAFILVRTNLIALLRVNPMASVDIEELFHKLAKKH